MSEIHHECGIAAIYHLPGELHPLVPGVGHEDVARLLPRMLQDIQNRGQLAAGMTSYLPGRPQLLATHKELGMVSEAFRLSQKDEAEAIMSKNLGIAAIGHVRYATCGADDRNYAQPFERSHIEKRKWFSFAFNGQLANVQELRDKLLADTSHHLTRDNDTEVIMHEIGREMSGERRPTLIELMTNLSRKFDGAYSIVLLNAQGDMLVARDPLGIKPLCYAKEGNLFAAASESVPLLNLGFQPESIKSLPPGYAITIINGEFDIQRYADTVGRAHCYFEWIYFANVASTLDERSVYLSRTALGEELARLELLDGSVPIDENTIVVPVPDTSKAAADAMAHRLRVPSREGLIRNRYSGRTFIEGGASRRKKAETKYTPLREVMQGKRVFLVEDSIVRSTTMRVLLNRIRTLGGAKEIHVRVACPPIVAPCFYGIDMSTIDELFAPKFLQGREISPEIEAEMAASLGADSLRYLPVESIAKAVRYDRSNLCQACITGTYPTPCGQKLYQIARENVGKTTTGDSRTYEVQHTLTFAQ
ncbi:amidophosphoribosyltransferase [Anatilimnocola sp. NA78]|uniref:amidophosphoribosyltransferase n=1 Tax=Anatilimnocola sp. NA78 TaxID=3415683 RepID=UPI003CE4B1AA